MLRQMMMADAAPSSAYVYRFRSNGTFTMPSTVTLQMLVVAGGASGGSYGGGGGGGGGVQPLSRSLVAGTYNVTVGLGGASVLNHVGNNGGTSSIDTFVSATGGIGGLAEGGGAPGGASGAGYVDGVLTAPSYPGNDPGSAGGGGGAAQAGGSSGASGGVHFGGNGYLWPVLGEYFGGGGGGSNSASLAYAGGLGGGGQGGNSISGGPSVAAQPGTDGMGGGGGGTWTGSSPKGGDGVVIIVSPVPITYTGTVIEG